MSKISAFPFSGSRSTRAFSISESTSGSPAWSFLPPLLKPLNAAPPFDQYSLAMAPIA
jgi:hypothetical protein